MKTIVVTGAAGALGMAYARALVAAQHQVLGIDRRDGFLQAFRHVVDNPFIHLGAEHRKTVQVQGVDLADAPRDRVTGALRGADAVVMTAANALPDQSRQSAARNHAIDANTIDAAIEAGCRVIIYTSSLWRMKGLLDGDALVTPAMAAPESHYGESKQRTWDLMRVRAAAHPDLHFVVNDHGWYPREAMGAPPMNVPDRGLQTWVAERETQAHILQQIGLPERAGVSGNFHGFIVASRNIPNEEAVRSGHRPFILDLSSSAWLGVNHAANVYDLYAQYRTWRTVPICMD